MKKLVTLSIFLIVTTLCKAQDYVAQSIGYNPPNSYIQNNTLVNLDDVYSNIISLGFNFEFYGNTYSEIVIGSNGIINFDTTLALDPCPWAFSEDIPSTSLEIKNAIYGPYHDMDISASSDAQINYGMYGTAPNRRFVVNFFENPMFSGACNDLLATAQIVLYETTNIVDVYMKDKPFCTLWNDGNAALGIINDEGLQGVAAAGRNTSDGPWEAYNEAWRFNAYQGTEVEANSVIFAVCDLDGDGLEAFDFSIIEPDVIGVQTNVTVTFHETFLDANNNVLPLISPYVNLVNPQLVFARVENNEGLYATSEIELQVLDCLDDDNDGVDTINEDLNGDGFLGNDDTDNDGIPNYLDPDDDNDNVDTLVETTGIGSGITAGIYVYIDTDEDGLENYLDNDDDGDGINSGNEDYNQNGSPLDDDTNGNNLPDFLDPEVAIILNTDEQELVQIKLAPNPTAGLFSVEGNIVLGQVVVNMYDLQGRLTNSQNLLSENNQVLVDVDQVAAGIYIVELILGQHRVTKKLVKK